MDEATLKNAAALQQTIDVWVTMLDKTGERMTRLENRFTAMEQLQEQQRIQIAGLLQEKYQKGT